jgi:ubiquitin C
MENKKTLKEYNVEYEDSIYLGLRFRGVLNIFISTQQGKSFPLKLESSDTIEKIKGKIQEKEGIPAPQQILTFAGVKMEDERSLCDYHIRNECVLVLSVVEMKVV